MLKLQAPDFVEFILRRLKGSGHQAYIVGGAVRDFCLSRSITDWDVATSARPEQIKKLFRDVRLFALKKETVMLVDSGRHFEVTSFRGIKNLLEEDLGRRDFTINAMAYDTERSKILDPYGGQKDVARKVIRATGNPQSRFKEDPLRILRTVRLAVELEFSIDARTKNDMIELAALLRAVAPERIREELIKILTGPKPSAGFNALQKTGILKYILPELLEGHLKRQDNHHGYTIFKHVMETIDRVEPTPVLRLTALFHDIAKPRSRIKIDGKWRFYGHEKAGALLAEEIMGKLKFSREMIQRVKSLTRHHMTDYHSEWSDGAVRRLIRRVGDDQIMDLLTFRQADLLAQGLQDQKINLLNELKERIVNIRKRPVVTKSRQLAIDGHRVMKVLGIPAGPEVGNILKNLLEKVTDNPELNTEERLVALLKQAKTA